MGDTHAAVLMRGMLAQNERNAAKAPPKASLKRQQVSSVGDKSDGDGDGGRSKKGRNELHGEERLDRVNFGISAEPFMCPLTGKTFVGPVFCAVDRVTYEKEAILSFLKDTGGLLPFSGLMARPSDLIKDVWMKECLGQAKLLKEEEGAAIGRALLAESLADKAIARSDESTRAAQEAATRLEVNGKNGDTRLDMLALVAEAASRQAPVAEIASERRSLSPAVRSQVEPASGQAPPQNADSARDFNETMELRRQVGNLQNQMASLQQSIAMLVNRGIPSSSGHDAGGAAV